MTTRKSIKTKKPRWKSFEESAMQTSSKIFSSQIVKPNQKVMGTISQALRQIDIKVGEEEFIDVECKDHAKPVDLPIIEQFANKLKDENAKSGIIISNSGFTQSALRTAKHYNIRPVSLIDKGHMGASNFVIKAPVVATGYYLEAMSYAVSQNSGQDFRFSPLVWDMKAVEGSTAHRNLYELFRDHWNDGTISISKEGSYQYAFDNVKIRDLRGDDILVNLKYNYVVKADVRLGSVGAESARGFFDLNNNTFTSSENIVFEPIEIDKISEWPRIAEDIPAPKQPLQLIGLFPLPNEPPQSSYQNPFTGEMLDPAKVEKGIYL